MTRADEILGQIIVKTQENQKAGKGTLVVFDLDSTLFDVSPRQQKILENYYQEVAHQTQFPEYSKYFTNIKTLKSDWGIKQAIIRSGLTAAPENFVESVRNYWRTHFFSNPYLEFDHPAEGAVEFVNELHQLGVRICYLTGRDVHRMGEGTEKVLKKWNFPLGDRAELYLKPHRSMDDVAYKEDWFKQIDRAQYANIWFFENEPLIIERLRVTTSFVSIVFFESTHSGKAVAPTDLPTIQHFNWKK